MGEYNIVPDFRDYKSFKILAIVIQLVAIFFFLLGYFVTSMINILTCIFQLISFYYAGLFACTKYYRLNITPNFITVWSIFNKPKKYCSDKTRWQIRKIPWYNVYFILLYSSGRIPIAIIKPHWKNALRITRFPHLGKVSSVELDYLNFLRKMGLL